MSVYRRTLWGMIKGIAGAPFAGILVIVVLGFFVEDQKILIGAGAAVALIIIYLSIFNENIRFELDSDGSWRYYKKGRLKKTYDMNQCMIGYHQKSEGGLFGDHDITLQILCENGTETQIDCSAIGLNRFHDMYEKMKTFTRQETEVLRAGSNE